MVKSKVAPAAKQATQAQTPPPAAEQKANPAQPAAKADPQARPSIVADVQAMVRLTKRLGVDVACRVIEDVENHRA